MTLRMTRRTALFAPAAVGIAVLSGVGPARAGAVYTLDGVAIGGIDPISYYRSTGPRRGRPDLTATWQGATWHFVTQDHRDQFAAAPERWAPCYGGYCAFAMSRGYALGSRADVWLVADGRLYLFHALAVRDLFNRDQAMNIRLANEAWPMVSGALGG